MGCEIPDDADVRLMETEVDPARREEQELSELARDDDRSAPVPLVEPGQPRSPSVGRQHHIRISRPTTLDPAVLAGGDPGARQRDGRGCVRDAPTSRSSTSCTHRARSRTSSSPGSLRASCAHHHRRLGEDARLRRHQHEPVGIFDSGVLLRDPESFGEFTFDLSAGDIVSPHIEAAEPLPSRSMTSARRFARGWHPRSSSIVGVEVVRMMEAVDQSLASNGRPRRDRLGFRRRASTAAIGLWPSAAAGGRDALEEKLGDLDGVQRRALAQVVAGQVEGHAVLGRRVPPDAADEHLVPACCPGRASGQQQLGADARARRRRISTTSSGFLGSLVAGPTLRRSGPTITGTRRARRRDREIRELEDLAGLTPKLRLLVRTRRPPIPNPSRGRLAEEGLLRAPSYGARPRRRRTGTSTPAAHPWGT